MDQRHFDLGRVSLVRTRSTTVASWWSVGEGRWRNLFALMVAVPRVLVPALFAVAVPLSLGTHASFTADASFETQSVRTGQWVPNLVIRIEPAHPNQLWVYTAPPCVKLESDIPDVAIYYEFAASSDPSEHGLPYRGGCLELPDEIQISMSALAVNPINDAWKSRVETTSFRVKGEEAEPAVDRKKKTKPERESEEDGDNDESDNHDTFPTGVLETFPREGIADSTTENSIAGNAGADDGLPVVLLESDEGVSGVNAESNVDGSMTIVEVDTEGAVVPVADILSDIDVSNDDSDSADRTGSAD